MTSPCGEQKETMMTKKLLFAMFVCCAFGALPKRYPLAAMRAAVQSTAKKAFPEHWGEPPRIQTRDFMPPPGGFGRGSSTLAKWIRANRGSSTLSTCLVATPTLW